METGFFLSDFLKPFYIHTSTYIPVKMSIFLFLNTFWSANTRCPTKNVLQRFLSPHRRFLFLGVTGYYLNFCRGRRTHFLLYNHSLTFLPIQGIYSNALSFSTNPPIKTGEIIFLALNTAHVLVMLQEIKIFHTKKYDFSCINW